MPNAGPQAVPDLAPGDLVTITEGERPPFTDARRSGYRILSMRGKVAVVQRLPDTKYETPGKPQSVSVDRIRRTYQYEPGQLAPRLTLGRQRRQIRVGQGQQNEGRGPAHAHPRGRDPGQPRGQVTKKGTVKGVTPSQPATGLRRSDRLQKQVKKNYCEL